MGRWVRAATVDEISAGRGATVNVEGRNLAIFHQAGSFFVIDDQCPHRGASLGEGTLHQGRVICPWHSWVFDIKTGECVRVPGVSVTSYAARVVDGTVEVELPDEGEESA